MLKNYILRRTQGVLRLLRPKGVHACQAMHWRIAHLCSTGNLASVKAQRYRSMLLIVAWLMNTVKHYTHEEQVVLELLRL
jgi:hypothetical protein